MNILRRQLRQAINAFGSINNKMMWSNHRLSNMRRLYNSQEAQLYRFESPEAFGSWSNAIGFRQNRASDLIIMMVSCAQLLLITYLINISTTSLLLLISLAVPSTNSHIWHNIRYGFMWVSGLENILAVIRAYSSKATQPNKQTIDKSEPIINQMNTGILIELVEQAFSHNPIWPDGFNVLAQDTQSEHFYLLESTKNTNEVTITIPGMNSGSITETAYAIHQIGCDQFAQKTKNLKDFIDQIKPHLQNKQITIVCQSMGTIYGPIFKEYIMKITKSTHEPQVVLIEPRACTEQLIACQNTLRNKINVKTTTQPVQSINIYADPNHWNTHPLFATQRTSGIQQGYWLSRENIALASDPTPGDSEPHRP